MRLHVTQLVRIPTADIHELRLELLALEVLHAGTLGVVAHHHQTLAAIEQDVQHRFEVRGGLGGVNSGVLIFRDNSVRLIERCAAEEGW